MEQDRSSTRGLPFDAWRGIYNDVCARAVMRQGLERVKVTSMHRRPSLRRFPRRARSAGVYGYPLASTDFGCGLRQTVPALSLFPGAGCPCEVSVRRYKIRFFTMESLILAQDER